MADAVIADLLVELINELRPFRARSDEAHVAAQYIEQLRQFIQAHHADECPYPRGTVIILLRPAGDPILLGINAHATEFDQLESLPALTHARLPIEDRPTRFKPDAGRSEQHGWPRQQQQSRGRHEIEEPLAQLPGQGMIKATGEDQGRRIHHIELDHSSLTLEEIRQVSHAYSALCASQQLLHRQPATALVRRNHDLVDVEFAGQFQQSFGLIELQGLRHYFPLPFYRQETHQKKGMTITASTQAAVDQIRILAGSEYQDTPLETLRIEYTLQQHAQQEHHDDGQGQRNRQYTTTDIGLWHHVIHH